MHLWLPCNYGFVYIWKRLTIVDLLIHMIVAALNTRMHGGFTMSILTILDHIKYSYMCLSYSRVPAQWTSNHRPSRSAIKATHRRESLFQNAKLVGDMCRKNCTAAEETINAQHIKRNGKQYAKKIMDQLLERKGTLRRSSSLQFQSAKKPNFFNLPDDSTFPRFLSYENSDYSSTGSTSDISDYFPEINFALWLHSVRILPVIIHLFNK